VGWGMEVHTLGWVQVLDYKPSKNIHLASLGRPCLAWVSLDPTWPAQPPCPCRVTQLSWNIR
jgi:hypothetical protein